MYKNYINLKIIFYLFFKKQTMFEVLRILKDNLILLNNKCKENTNDYIDLELYENEYGILNNFMTV